MQCEPHCFQRLCSGDGAINYGCVGGVSLHSSALTMGRVASLILSER